MTYLRCWAIVVFFVAFGATVQTAFATEPTEIIVPSIVLEGFLLDDSDMEKIEGGLPRACRDLKYDSLENSCLNNKGQDYQDAKNDCDIWLEDRVKDSGKDISKRWDPAATTTVAGHMKKLEGQLLDEAPLGWSVEFIDGSHVALVRVNEDGSADIYHQGQNRETPTTKRWKGSRGYHYSEARSAYWGKQSTKFWKF